MVAPEYHDVFMSAPAVSLSVWVGECIVCVKIAGRANFTASVDFKQLIYGLHDQGHSRFVLDLTDCLLLDSTFLGVLAGMGLKLGNPDDRQPAIELLNPSPRISDLLENLGVTHLFKLASGPAPVEENSSPIPCPASNAPKSEITRTCLDAHRLLMDINPDNVPKFKDVATFLAEDLKRMENGKA